VIESPRAPSKGQHLAPPRAEATSDRSALRFFVMAEIGEG